MGVALAATFFQRRDRGECTFAKAAGKTPREDDSWQLLTSDTFPSAGWWLAGTDASIWHINADEPSVLDYDTEYKSAGQVISLYAADEYRSSDHDPEIVDLELGEERIYLPVVMRDYPLP